MPGVLLARAWALAAGRRAVAGAAVELATPTPEGTATLQRQAQHGRRWRGLGLLLGIAAVVASVVALAEESVFLWVPLLVLGSLAGVLLAEEGGYYQIRVIGGEVRIPKAAVFKVESDAQTLETLAAAEAAGQEQRAQDDRERRERQRSRRASRGRAPRARVAEASFSRPEAPARRFDPVVGVSSTDNGHLQCMQDAERAFAQTRDRRYLKLLRRLRRMR